MSTNLPPELNRLIAQEIALGHYRTEEELLTEAVLLLTQRNALREQVEAGTRQLEAGEFTDYDSQSLRAIRRPQRAANVSIFNSQREG
jgi:Arc/MetJ-type ribon-helix-helix transcriptional regulator